VELLEIYGDERGETHFRKSDVELNLRDFAPPSAPLEISAEIPATTSLFLVAPPGWDDAVHPSPRQQFAILLDGMLQVTLTDGESTMMKPGDIVLLNDQDSKGHLSQVRGDRPTRFLLVGCGEES